MCLNNVKLNRKFIDKILTGIQHTDKIGLLGKKENKFNINFDINFDIDFSSLINLIGNIDKYKKLSDTFDKKIVNIRQQISPKSYISTNDVVRDLDISNIKLGACICIHNRYKLTKLCLVNFI